MKNVKWLVPTVIVVVLLVTAAIVLNSRYDSGPGKNAAHPKTYKVGVFEVVRHPVLDSMAQTFQTELNKSLSGHVEFVTMVPEGDASKTEQMAQEFATDNYDLVFVIGTNQAQSLAKKTTTIPIVLGAATDPKAAGLVGSWEVPGGNITGTSDLSPIGAQLDRMSEILPKARRVGIIYNPAEDNSTIIVGRFKSECENRGLEPVAATISNQNEVRQTLVSLVGKIDVLYAPTDATIQSAFDLLIGTADELKIPVFNCDEGTVNKGALFSVGFDYSDLGRIAAEMATEIFNAGKSPASMPIRLADKVQLFYNPAPIEKLGLTLPESWKVKGRAVAQ